MSIELKPCPFCGGRARIDGYIHQPVKKWFVECADNYGLCFMPITNSHQTRQEAAAQWNKRGAT